MRTLTLVLALAIVARPTIGQAPQPETKVVLLGTGTPNADPDRSGPAVAIVVGDQSYLIDAGPASCAGPRRPRAIETCPRFGRPIFDECSSRICIPITRSVCPI